MLQSCMRNINVYEDASRSVFRGVVVLKSLGLLVFQILFFLFVNGVDPVKLAFLVLDNTPSC